MQCGYAARIFRGFPLDLELRLGEGTLCDGDLRGQRSVRLACALIWEHFVMMCDIPFINSMLAGTT